MKSNQNLTPREAIDLFEPEAEPEPEAGMVKSDLDDLWSGGTTWVDAEYDERLPLALRPDRRLVDALVAGTWYATGHRVPATKPSERIPPFMWAFLELDIDAKTATGGGLEFAGVQVHETEPSSPGLAPEPEDKCFDWLRELMLSPKGKSRLDCLTEASEEIPNLSDKAFARAWKRAVKTTPPGSDWRKPGPLKSS